MKRVRAHMHKIRVHVCNLISNLLPDDWISRRVRIFLLNSLGNNISYKAKFHGGGYVAGGGLTVEAAAAVNRGCYFDLTAPIMISEHCSVGHGTTFTTARHSKGSAFKRAGTVVGHPISIGSGAWIQANATISPGTVVGTGAIVAACSLVNKDVQSNTIVAGVPAKFVRFINDASSHTEQNSEKRPLTLVS